MDKSQLILGIEVLIGWFIEIIKWSLITVVVSSILILILIGVVYVLKLNSSNLPKIELK
ncbi:MAG: hypothetical protein RSA57_03860 [Cetobacterium sp.]|uniref:hypothetical protein n=1 Tax=Bacteria TaxID=2 RepID=UPI002FC58D97